VDWRAMHARGEFPDAQPWPLFFHMPVLMLMLITLLNDGTLIAVGYDHVQPKANPESWNKRALVGCASVLALVSLASSLLLLWCLLDSWRPDGVFQKWGIGGVRYGKITSAIYLKISLSDFLTLFSARTGKDFFFSTRPSIVLIGAGFIALSLSTVISCTWPSSFPDGIATIGLALSSGNKLLALWIWIYCLVFWFIQDLCKVLYFQVVIRLNIFDYNETNMNLQRLSAGLSTAVPSEGNLSKRTDSSVDMDSVADGSDNVADGSDDA